MKFSVRKEKNKIILDFFSHKLDQLVVKRLNNQLNELISKGEDDIILNFSNIEYLDTSFLNCIINVHSKMLQKEGQLSVFGVCPDLIFLFHLIKLDNYLHIYTSEYDALQSHNRLIKRRFRVVS